MPTLDIISVNIWQIVASLCNLLIIFLILKKFLYKPVRGVLAQRQATIDAGYADAEKAKAEAEGLRAEYEEKLAGARDQAQRILDAAEEDAGRQRDAVIADAQQRAEGLILQARSETEAEKEMEREDIKRQISDISSLIAENVIRRQIDSDDQKKLIDSFIAQIGEDNDPDQ